METMRGRLLRMMVLLWLGWYVSGPLEETFDFWDSPQEEMADVARSAGELVALLGVAVAVSVRQLRKLRERWRLLARSIRRRFPPVIGPALLSAPPLSFRSGCRPLIPLRI